MIAQYALKIKHLTAHNLAGKRLAGFFCFVWFWAIIHRKFFVPLLQPTRNNNSKPVSPASFYRKTTGNFYCRTPENRIWPVQDAPKIIVQYFFLKLFPSTSFSAELCWKTDIIWSGFIFILVVHMLKRKYSLNVKRALIKVLEGAREAGTDIMFPKVGQVAFGFGFLRWQWKRLCERENRK